jgi:hypothetical protein
MIGRPGYFVSGKSLPGAVFWRWEPPVPYVPPYVLGSSIFLYGSERDATEGANWGGSGVLVGIPSEANPSRVHLYAVTNDHVVDGCPVVRLVNRAGEAHVLSGTQSDWHFHPDGDDIAVRPFGAVVERDCWYVPDEKLLAQGDLSPEEFPDQISPGDDCAMIGRYINQEFRQFDQPVVRFGNLAMLPELIYQEERSFEQESFLVDMRSHSGFSGSPVFVYYEAEGWRFLPPEPEEPVLPDIPEEADPEADFAVRQEAMQKIIEAHRERAELHSAHYNALRKRGEGRDTSGVMGKTWLLGLDWGHLPVWADVYDASKQKSGRMRVSTGMAGVVPAWKLRDLLNEKEVAMARDKTEKKLSEIDEGAAVLDASKPDEFAEFEDLARKLVQVPKRELDEKRKDES